jgi:predicted nucleic acid-binding protein
VLLLDTSFLSALWREERARHAGPAVALLRAHAVRRTIVSMVAAGEYLEWQGATPEGLHFLRRHTLIGLSMPIAERAALMQRRLARRLGENDAWLAATALHHGFTLVTADSDFDRVPRLKLLLL